MLHWNKKISRIGFKSQETDSGCGKCYKKGDFKLFENQMTINDKRKMSLTLQRKKVGLKLNIQKTKIMASSPITSWQIDGKTMETVRDFTFQGSKITAGNCSHKIKGHLLLGRKVTTNLDSILKSRDITLPAKSI